MSTHAIVTFTDSSGERVSVFRHHDGYPEREHGVVADVTDVLRGRGLMSPMTAAEAFIEKGHTARLAQIHDRDAAEYSYTVNLDGRQVLWTDPWTNALHHVDVAR